MSIPDRIRALKERVSSLEIATGHVLDDCCDPAEKPSQVEVAKDDLAWIITISGEILKELGEVAQPG